MATIDSTQERQVTYLSGVNSGNLADPTSYWTWNLDYPATYDGSGDLNFTAKFGEGIAGTGATITYGFDIASNWTATERAAFSATAKLWSAVANITFVETSAATAQVLLSRASDEGASGGQTDFTSSVTGTRQIGIATSGEIDIDTSVPGFGPIGTTLGNYGGYPYTALIHEWGHVLGLGHGGPYNASDDEAAGVSDISFGFYDNVAWTIMSYNEQSADWGLARGDNNALYNRTPTTWMPLDIVAIQRTYGAAVNTPLSGGQTYGFNSNITGEIGKFFDFNQNLKPVITLWNKGQNNIFDMSGTGQASTIDLNDGTFSSVLGMQRNVAIAYGTRIDTAITGSGDDRITGNNNSNYAMGGAGSDTIVGGTGNDHLYGAASVAVAGDGGDSISAGSGSDYLQGNAGDDTLNGGDGSDRIQGGQGSDTITGLTGNDSINGNLGNDTIDGHGGNDVLRGGQGNDSVTGSITSSEPSRILTVLDSDMVMGDLGADTLSGGFGFDTLIGGADADFFRFNNTDAIFTTLGEFAGLTDVVADYVDGIDRIDLAIPVRSMIFGAAHGNFSSAASAADQALAEAPAGKVVALAVGADTYLFFRYGDANQSEAVKILGVAPTVFTIEDFV